jgi:hypothetical protein
MFPFPFPSVTPFPTHRLQPLRKSFQASDVSTVVQFFTENTCRIEVLDAHGSLQRVYFPKPIVCNYLTSTTRNKVPHSAEAGRYFLARCP